MANVSSRPLGRVLGKRSRSLHWGGPMKIYQLGLITCALLTFGHAANAELKMVVATGTVTSIFELPAGDPFSIGDPMTAVITYNDAEPDQDPGSNGRYPIISYGFTVGGYSGSDDGRNIAIVNNFSGRDEIRIGTAVPPLTGDPAGGFPLFAFEVVGRDSTETIFSSDALPESLDLAAFTSFFFNVIFDDMGPPGERLPAVSGSVDSITITSFVVSEDITPVSSLLAMTAFSNIVSDKSSDSSTVGEGAGTNQFTTLFPLSIEVTADVSSEDEFNEFISTEGDITATWNDPAQGQVIWNVAWIAGNLRSTTGSFTTVSGLMPNGGWIYTFTAGKTGIFDLDFDVIIGGTDTFGLNGFNFEWFVPGAPLPVTSFMPTGTSGGITQPITAGDTFTVQITNNSGVFSTTGITDRIANMTGTFDWRIFDVAVEQDSDGDGIPDDEDNCPFLKQPVDFSDPDEPLLLDLDTDDDGFGDMCDECPLDKDQHVGPCLPLPAGKDLETVGNTLDGAILLKSTINFGKVVTVYRPSCGKTVTFEGVPQSSACDFDPSLPECQPLPVIHRQVAQVTPDDLCTGADFTLICDLRNHLTELDPDSGTKIIEVVASFTSEGHTSFTETPIEGALVEQIAETITIEQLTMVSPPADVVVAVPRPIQQVSCGVAPEPWYTIYSDTSVPGPPVEITLGIPIGDLSDLPDPILLNGVTCDGSGLDNPVVSTNGATTFLCERASAFSALGTVVAGDTAKFVVEGTDLNGDPFEATNENLCTIGIADPVEIAVDLPASINLDANGVTPVCLISQPGFDATTVIPLTVTVASATVKVKGNGDALASVEDCGGDSLQDLKVKIVTDAMTVVAGEVVEVRGETTDGISFVGQDTINIVPAE